jgi:phosphoglycolate phosphatase
MPYRERFRAVVFDLDGTLIETAPDLTDALNHTLALAGRPAVAELAVRQMVGDGARKLLERGLAATGPAPNDAEMDRWHGEFLTYYRANVAARSHPFPGAVDLMHELRAAGLKTAVCTNKPVDLSRKLFDDLEISHLFDAVIGGDSLPVRKPDPGHILGTLEAVGAGAAEAVMIGDSMNDVAAARNAGIPVIAVSFGYTTTPARELGADAVIDRLSELPAALAALA